MGYNLAKVSTPWAQCYSNGAWGVLTYARLKTLSGLSFHDMNFNVHPSISSITPQWYNAVIIPLMHVIVLL